MLGVEIYPEAESSFGDYLSTYLFFFAYYSFMEMTYGKTFGKMITKTIVVDAEGKKLNPMSIVGRSLCRFIPFEAFSFIASPVVWHDSISKTYCVYTRSLQYQDTSEEFTEEVE